MKVIYKNDGEYIDYSLSGDLLSFRGGELTLNLAELERDHPVSVTVSEDGTGRLRTGVLRRYIAEIDIPARRSVVEKTGVADDFGFPVLCRAYSTFDPNGVVLTLWAVK